MEYCRSGVLDPLISIAVSLCILGIMLYKGINLGITLCIVPIILSLLTLNLFEIPRIFYTTIDPFTQEGLLTILVILTVFTIAWLSLLYRETKKVITLGEGLSVFIKRRRIILPLLPALIGLLPIAGGALLSAPVVESESKKLNLSPDKTAYINFWFRHTIVPIFPLDSTLIAATAIMGLPILTIILYQIPVVIIMIIAGYLMSLRGVSALEEKERKERRTASKLEFLMSFSPILVAIALAVILSMIGNRLFQLGFNVLIGSIAGLITLIIVARVDLKILIRPLLNPIIYDITFATLGAFLIQNVIRAINIADSFKPLIQNGAWSTAWLLTIIPLFLGFFMGTPIGAIAITAPAISSIFELSPKFAALLYASAFLGYVIAPTHLCLVFSANYFRTKLTRIYKYVIPSFIITYLVITPLYLLL